RAVARSLATAGARTFDCGLPERQNFAQSQRAWAQNRRCGDGLFGSGLERAAQLSAWSLAVPKVRGSPFPKQLPTALQSLNPTALGNRPFNGGKRCPKRPQAPEGRQ